MKKAIVTGANGFIGSAVCRELANKGAQVIAVVKDEKERIDNIINVSGLQIIYCDLRNLASLPNLLSDRDINVFYHFAWVGSAGPLRGNCDVQLSNVRYSCDAVKACAEIGCKRFVFASSISEYEIIKSMETEMVPSIKTLYSSAKVAADYMSRAVAGELKIDYIRAVISNIYGPGELSPRLVNASLRKMLNGEHCAFSAGNQMYDFVYITDAAKAFAAIGKNGKANRTYYIGSQHPRPLKDFLIEMRDCVNPEIQIGLGELPFNSIPLTYDEFDVNAVKVDTGFIPEVNFKEGIIKTITWLKEGAS